MLGGKDTGSQRDHLAKTATGRAMIASVSCPPCFRTFYRHFRTLSLWRGASGMGASPLTLHDVDAYERRYGVTFLPGLLDLLKLLDADTLSPSAA